MPVDQLLTPQDAPGIVIDSLDWDMETRGFSGSALAFYSPSYLEGFDYITANFDCETASTYLPGMKSRFAIRYSDAQRWGKFKNALSNPDDPHRPKRGKEWLATMPYIKIPTVIIETVFKGVQE